jgi:prevent-host-death family protein
MELSAKELRTRIRDLLAAVERGENVTITYRGRARARVVGTIPEQGSRKRDLVRSELFGIWRDRRDLSDVQAYVDELRRSRR